MAPERSDAARWCECPPETPARLIGDEAYCNVCDEQVRPKAVAAYTPVMIWLDGADDDWLERALSRFVVVFEPGPDGKRAFVATGPLRRHPAGLVVPPKTGRNSPCPCGSGKKFKRCHGG